MYSCYCYRCSSPPGLDTQTRPDERGLSKEKKDNQHSKTSGRQYLKHHFVLRKVWPFLPGFDADLPSRQCKMFFYFFLSLVPSPPSSPLPQFPLFLTPPILRPSPRLSLSVCCLSRLSPLPSQILSTTKTIRHTAHPPSPPRQAAPPPRAPVSGSSSSSSSLSSSSLSQHHHHRQPQPAPPAPASSPTAFPSKQQYNAATPPHHRHAATPPPPPPSPPRQAAAPPRASGSSNSSSSSSSSKGKACRPSARTTVPAAAPPAPPAAVVVEEAGAAVLVVKSRRKKRRRRRGRGYHSWDQQHCGREY